MIRKLRIKFIAISMTSTIIVLFLILGSINLLNYREMSHNADTILDFLKENDGELPENLYKSQHKKTNGISPETSFESRYFSVFLSNNRQICEADTDNISAIDEETAIKYAQKINRSNKNCGFISKYRYMKENTSNGVKIYFLDCTKSMMSFQTFLVTSFFVSIFGVSTVFILVVLLSKRAIEPVAESYEKQKRFITDAGHEIKTPLTIIDADTSILEMEYGENEWLDDIQVQTKRLAGLTNDLIYLSRMEEKQTKTTMIEFPFSEVISEEAQSFQGLAKVKGKNFMELSERKLRKERQNIGMIFQHFNLLMQRTALDNVCFPMEIVGISKKEARKKALEYLKIVGLEEKALSYPSQLSGGQKQRVAIARVLASDPEILLCDEATSALDPQTTKSILELIRKINKEYGITVVVITHEMSVVQEICNRVAVLERGVLVESGTVEELFRSPKTEAARRLVFSGRTQIQEMNGKRLVRVTFKDKSSFEPVIANLVLTYRTSVNILYADTKNIGGAAEGEMILQLPEIEETAEKMIEYLRETNMGVEELSSDVG